MFQLPDEAIVVIFISVGLLHKDTKSLECNVKWRGLENFESEHHLSNKNAETSEVQSSSNYLNQHALMKLGNCADYPAQA